MTPSPRDILARHGRATEQYLAVALPRVMPGAPARLIEAINYSLFAGGKRLRPALVLESAEAAASGSAARREQPTAFASSALAAAGAIELIHTFSLVHDDLPAMDDDDLRRGRPTSHKVFGDAIAILSGDAMTTLAFELIARDADPAVAPRLIAELASASGPCGMIGGQVLDIAAENQTLAIDQLNEIHRRKTGALISAACRMGAVAASADDQVIESMTRFADHVGLAFQIVDDLLDATASTQQLGKSAGKDQVRGKSTYPGLLGIDAARAEARRQIEQALDALSGFGGGANGLRAIARFVLERTA